MQKTNRTYFILTYLFFLYPPFIFGLVEVYSPGSDNVHLITLLINIFVILILFGATLFQVNRKKIHQPTREERNYLLFGLAGNIIVFFYTFQYQMELQNIINVYLILLLVLSVSYLLISKKFIPKELWIILPVYAFFDYLVLLLRNCGWERDYSCLINSSYDPFLKVVFTLIVLLTVFYYAYRVLLYKLYDVLKVINIVFIIYLSYAASRDLFNGDEFTMTILILYPFFVFVDFIIKLVNKTYTHTMLLFYIRTFTIFIIFSILGMSGYFESRLFEMEVLPLMVVVTYFSLGISILKYIFNIEIKDANPINVIRATLQGPKFVEAKRSHIVSIQEQFNDMLASHVKIGPDAYSVVATLDDKIIGFISTYKKHLTAPLSDDLEAYINVIEVHTDYRNLGIATKLVQMTEHYFKAQGVKQIRAWSSVDKYEAIHLWDKLKYTMSPTTITFKEGNIDVEGYFVTKRF